MEAVYPIADLRIRALAGFVREVAAGLELGNPLASTVRSAATRHPAAADAFELDQSDSMLEANFALKNSLTFADEILPGHVHFQRQRKTMSLKLDDIMAGDVRSLLAMCGSGRRTAAEIRDELDEPIAGLFESLLENGILAEGIPLPLFDTSALRTPGVTRLQHAGLYYRGKDAGILVDPHFQSSYEPHDLGGNFLRFQFEGLVDAIVISHGHRDHWHLPTLMTFPHDTLIVVPTVPRATMLCPDFAQTLHALGFTRVVAVGWRDPPLVVGDLEVHAFPFYGEQPLRNEATRHPDLRNHGNTYVVRHRSYTSWFLVDSGDDWMGRMAEVAQDVKARFGRIDLLISNLREFPIGNPLYITGGHYWLALTPDQLRRFSRMRGDVITLGPRGVAEICRIVRAQKFLPYAHWWGMIGQPPGPEEVRAIEQLRSSLAQTGSPTQIVPWRVGDTHIPS